MAIHPTRGPFVNRCKSATVLGIFAFVSAMSARAQSSPPEGSPGPATFVTKAAQGGMTEVALSKAASTQSSDPSVKKFAEQMIHDHQNANNELSSIARKKRLNVPASLDAEHQAVVQNINNKSGSEFDQ